MATFESTIDDIDDPDELRRMVKALTATVDARNKAINMMHQVLTSLRFDVVSLILTYGDWIDDDHEHQVVNAEVPADLRVALGVTFDDYELGAATVDGKRIFQLHEKEN